MRGHPQWTLSVNDTCQKYKKTLSLQMISSSREWWDRVPMKEFPVHCPCWRTPSRKNRRQPQLFLCPLVTLCSHQRKHSRFPIWTFISGTVTTQDRALNPTPCHTCCIAWLFQPLPVLSPVVSSLWSQGSELTSVNSFCIYQKVIEPQNVRAAGRAFSELSPDPLHRLSNPFIIQVNQQTFTEHPLMVRQDARC